LLGEWVLDLLLDGPLEGPRPIDRIEARFAQEIERRFVERQIKATVDQTTS
jgi:hypothetical protein